MSMTQISSDTNIWFLVAIATLILLVLWGLRVVKRGSVSLAWNRTAKRLGILAIGATSSLLVSSNKIEAILNPFGPGTLVLLFLIAAVGGTLLDGQTRHILRWTLMTIVSLAGLLAIYQFVGLTKLIEITPGLMTTFVLTLPFIASEARDRRQSDHDKHRMVAIVMALVCVGGLALTTYQILPRWNEATLPYFTNWQVLLESYKNWQHLLVGVGAENFLGVFTAGRPTDLNMTPLWNTRFALGSSLFFHIATVYGLVGTAALGWFLVNMHPVAILAFLFLPPSFPALVVASALLILSEPVLAPKRFNLLWLGYPIAIGVLLLAGAAGYGLFRSYGAELAFARSLAALENRDGTATYNLQIQAISRNPYITRFHTAYSQTNLALANAMAENTATASADRQTATQLVQQAIREAKIAVGLSPTNVLAWENIGGVYQSLIGVAQGADQWAIAAYQRAIQLDPTNPGIRLRLGGAYVGQQKFDAAAESYLMAIRLKPDYANAYYYLAFAYRQQKKYLLAAQALKESITYVTPDTDDARRGQTELEELRELLTEEEKRALDTQTQATPNVLSPLPESP